MKRQWVRPMSKVLLIEDDEVMRLSIKQSLELEDIQVIATNGLEQAKSLIRLNFVGIVLSDIRMPRFDGFDVLKRVQDVDPSLPVILITGEADVPMAISAMKKGAYDLLEKPCSTVKLLDTVQRALRQRQSTLNSRRLQRQLISTDSVSKSFPGQCSSVKLFRRKLRNMMDENNHVFIIGEAGSGKRAAADCLLQARQEIGDILHINANQQDECQTLSTHENLKSVCVHHIERFSAKNLAALAANSHERDEFRIIALSSFETPLYAYPFYEQFGTLNVPNLEERASDLGVIFESLVRQIEQSYGIEVKPIDAKILHHVTQSKLHGNLEELRKFARAFVLGGDESALSDEQSHASMMQNFERLIMAQALKASNGNATDAANSLGLPRKTFYDRWKKLNITRSDILG